MKALFLSQAISMLIRPMFVAMKRIHHSMEIIHLPGEDSAITGRSPSTKTAQATTSIGEQAIKT